MIWCQKSNRIGGLTSSPNHSILILRVMKGHSEMGQSQKSEGTAIANQLHKCHVANMSLSIPKITNTESVANVQHCVLNSTLHKCHCQGVKINISDPCKYVTLQKYHVLNISHKNNRSDPVLNRSDPAILGSDPALPSVGNQAPSVGNQVNPPMEIDLTPRWKKSKVIRIEENNNV